MKFPLLVMLLCALAGWPAAAGAAEFEPVAAIRAAAIGAVLDAGESDAQVDATLDSALRLPRCENGLQARATGPATVEVVCTDAAGWRLFVPVRVRRSQRVLVLTRPVSAGETINADALTLETRDAGRLSGSTLSDPAQAIGRSVRRTLMAGAVLDPGDLVSSRLVRRGDNVTLIARTGAIEVRMMGRALGEAGANERVSVENLSSRRIIQGVVAANGDVVVAR